MTLLQAMQTNLKYAEDKLQRAKQKQNNWEVKLYTNSIKFIEGEIEIIKSNTRT